MIASRVVSKKELDAALKSKGFKPTEESTDTGTFWRHCDTGKHVLIPESVQGFYPDWLLSDIYDQIETLRINWMNHT